MKSRRGGWSRFAAVVASLLAGCVGDRPLELWPWSAGAAIERLPLDDFEAPGDGRYGRMDDDVPPEHRGELDWRRAACDRSGASGTCLHLRADLGGGGRRRATFRIDLGGIDASGWDRLELWIRGDGRNGEAPDLRVGFRRPRGDGKLVEDGTEWIEGISGGWRRVVLPLNRFSGIRDWKDLRYLFFEVDSRGGGMAEAGASAGYWIDDVALLDTGGFGPSIYDGVEPVAKRAWEEARGGRDAARADVLARLRGFPTRLRVPRDELPAGDRAFLERLAADTWKGLLALTDRENGLPLDHVVLSTESLAAEHVRLGDYTNVTNVGLHLIAIVAARELGLVAAEEAVRLLERVLATLERLETHEGFFFNYYDTVTLERTSHFLSFVDSSWLTAGLMVARAAEPAVREQASRLLEREDYGFFYDAVAEKMSHGYYVNVPTRSEYHYGALFTEARLGSLIAIGKGDAPEEHWFRLERVYPREMRWQSQSPRVTRQRVRGFVVDGGTYEWGGLRYVPSWGGSMFEALMPTLVVDEKRHAPRSLGRNGHVHATIQRRYATEVLGYPVWGLSPAADPEGGGYAEFGVPVLGTLGYGGGAVAPYAGALALGPLPEATTANLRRLVESYDVYGEYGFYDAVDPSSGAVAHQYLALDQSMVLIALANHLERNVVTRLFATDPIARRALAILGDEDFFAAEAAG
jgi:hypothetical protein